MSVLHIAKWLTSVALTLVVLFSALLLLLAPVGIRDTIEKSRKIDALFKAAVSCIGEDRISHRQLPTEAEVRACQTDQSGSYPIGLQLPGAVSQEALDAVGAPPPDSYILWVWRGEWAEYYAPWSGKSTLTLDEGPYYLTGNRYLDMALGIGVNIAALVAHALMWGLALPWRRRRKQVAPE